MTLYLCWGENGGFNVEWTPRCKRICLWWISLALINVDIEIMMDKAVDKINELKLK